MAIFSVRRVRDAFVKADVTDEAKGLELAADLDEALSERVVTTERLETLEDRIDARFRDQDARIDARFREQDARIDARFREQDARIDARFAQADADAERRANRHTAILIGAIAIAVGVVGILIAVL